MIVSLPLVFAAGLAIPVPEAPISSSSTTISWAVAIKPTCGEWTSKADIGDAEVQYVCKHGAETRTISKPGLDAQACEDWCRSSRLPDSDVGAWCCQLDSTPSGEVCTWTEGHAEPELPEGSPYTSSVYLVCPEESSDEDDKEVDGGVTLLGKQLNWEYQCPSNKKQDAIKIDGDGPNTCSQICLPHHLWGIARRNGVIEGNCKDWGYTNFLYQSSNTGIKYNVYARG